MRSSRHTRTTTASLFAVALVLTACGGGDGEPSAGTAGGDDLEEAIAAEAEELGVELTDEELAEAADELDTSDMSGHAEVTLDGEDLPMDGVTCGPAEEEGRVWGYEFEARGPGGDFAVWFSTAAGGDQDGEFIWDHPSGVDLWAMPDGIPYTYMVIDSDEVTASEGQASGTVEVKRNQNHEDPPVELAFDLRCD